MGLLDRLFGGSPRDTREDLWGEPWQVEAGSSVGVAAPDGEPISVKLAPIMTEGTTLRFRGKGRGGRGDLYLRLRIRAPR